MVFSYLGTEIIKDNLYVWAWDYYYFIYSFNHISGILKALRCLYNYIEMCLVNRIVLNG